jgi:hypothetical protein
MMYSFVCAMPAINMAHPYLFRTYKVAAVMNLNCHIWEAARATTAAPTFFKRISIGEPGQVKTEFIDGAVKCNNPTEVAIRDARQLFGDKQRIGVIVSLGTGHPGTIGLSNPDGFQRILPTKLINVLKRIATDCESTADRLARRFQKLPGFYFRFNVDHGTGHISLEEWKKMGDVQAHTIAYLQGLHISQSINAVVSQLCGINTGQSEHQVTLADLDLCTSLYILRIDLVSGYFLANAEGRWAHFLAIVTHLQASKADFGKRKPT